MVLHPMTVTAVAVTAATVTAGNKTGVTVTGVTVTGVTVTAVTVIVVTMTVVTVTTWCIPIITHMLSLQNFPVKYLPSLLESTRTVSVAWVTERPKFLAWGKRLHSHLPNCWFIACLKNPKRPPPNNNSQGAQDEAVQSAHNHEVRQPAGPDEDGCCRRYAVKDAVWKMDAPANRSVVLRGGSQAMRIYIWAT